MQFTSKQITIIVVAIASIFILMGIFTIVAVVSDDSDDTSNDTKTEVVEQKPNVEQEEEPTDSIVINAPIEGDPYEELDELIGLESVKEEVRTLANFVKVQKMREKQGMKIPKMSYHLVFTGSPGTGKTTVARIVARIYKDLGILKKGHTVETDRSGLVAEYVGQTAVKTNAIVDSALNGVLFIDEAYALVPEQKGSDYGQEAISTLLKRMEDDRDKLVVIIAGYTNEMQRFIDSNPGLQSRFNRYIDFPDYTAEELFRIFEMQARKNEYTIANDAKAYLQERLEYVVAHKDRNFGNARYVRNVFEKAVQVQANRLSGRHNLSRETLAEITKSDIEEALKGKSNISHK
ncbi:MAG: AAA family ATPase [Bacteroidaceae bacterium]|nr:AAA family ATPase [Bacteroidaceae bacterium]